MGVANTGVSDALNVTVGDTLPVGVTLSGAVTCAATGTANCGIVTGIAPQTSFGATGAQVSAGAGNFLTFTVPVSFAASLADNPLLNTATANDLASGANGSATDSDTLAAQADLAITKTDGVVSVAPGTTTTYTIVVTNNGPGNVVGATVTDVMPAAIASDTFHRSRQRRRVGVHRRRRRQHQRHRQPAGRKHGHVHGRRRRQRQRDAAIS